MSRIRRFTGFMRIRVLLDEELEGGWVWFMVELLMSSSHLSGGEDLIEQVKSGF